MVVATLPVSHFQACFKTSTLGPETFANFVQIRESLRREKFYIDQFVKVYAREIFKFFLFFL